MNLCLFCALIITAILSGCVSSGITPVGSNALNPLPKDSPVSIYSSESDVHKEFTVVAIVSYTNPGKYQVLSLSNVIPDLKKEARKAGANGLIVDETHPIKSGLISTGIGVTGRAIVLH